MARQLGEAASGWAAFNVPSLWSAAEDAVPHPILQFQWLSSILDTVGASDGSVGLGRAFLALRSGLRQAGITDRADLFMWLRANDYPCMQIGGYFDRPAQERLLELTELDDYGTTDLQRYYVAAALGIGRSLELQHYLLHHIRTLPPDLPPAGSLPPNVGATETIHNRTQNNGSVRARATVGPVPDGWRNLDELLLAASLDQDVTTLKAVPRCIRGSWARILTQTLSEISLSHQQLDRGV